MKRTKYCLDLAQLANALDQIECIDGEQLRPEMHADPQRADQLVSSRCKSVVHNLEAPDACSYSDESLSAGNMDSDEAPSAGDMDSDNEFQAPRLLFTAKPFGALSTMFSMNKKPSGLTRTHHQKGVVDARKDAKKRLRNDDAAASSTATASATAKKVRSEQPYVRPLSAMELPFPVSMPGQEGLMLSVAGKNEAAPSPSDITAVLK